MIGPSSGCGYAGLGSLDGDGDLASDTQPSGGEASGDGDDSMHLGGGSATGGKGNGGVIEPDGTGGVPGSGGRNGEIDVWDGTRTPCSLQCADSLLLYRPFEVGIPGVVKEDTDASVTQSTDVVHSGKYSLATSQGAPHSDAQITDAIRPISDDHIYYRAWIYIPEGAITDWFKVLAFNGSSEGMDVNFHASGAIEIYSQLSGASLLSDVDVVPVGEWFCLQVHDFVANMDGLVEVSVNEEEVVTMTATDTQPGLGVDNLVYGLAETGPSQTGATIYTDDIVASTEPVPCGPLP